MKRILAIILGVMLMITPFAGCKKAQDPSETGYRLSEEGEKIKLSFNGEDVFSQEIKNINGILLQPEKEGIPELYVEEDGTIMKELFETMSLKNVVLTETEESVEEKIRVVFEKDWDLIDEMQFSFSVTKQGVIEYFDETADKYYASKSGVTDYNELLNFCAENQYEFPCRLTKEGENYVFINNGRTLFSYNAVEIVKMVTQVGSNLIQITDSQRIERLFDSLFNDTNLRLCGSGLLYTISNVAYTFYTNQRQVDLFIEVMSNGKIKVGVGEIIYISEVNKYDFELFLSYFMEDYAAQRKEN